MTRDTGKSLQHNGVQSVSLPTKINQLPNVTNRAQMCQCVSGSVALLKKIQVQDEKRVDIIEINTMVLDINGLIEHCPSRCRPNDPRTAGDDYSHTTLYCMRN